MISQIPAEEKKKIRHVPTAIFRYVTGLAVGTCLFRAFLFAEGSHGNADKIAFVVIADRAFFRRICTGVYIAAV